MPEAFPVALLVAALGSGLNGGVFYAFSTFVMDGLGRVPAPAGVATMQSINVAALPPPFMALFMGTTVLCLGTAVACVVRWGSPGALPGVVGCALYLVGCFGVTAAFNVPRNNTLMAVDPAAPAAAAVWADYQVGWTRWNHVRTAACALAAVALIVALVRAWSGRA